MVYVEKWSTGNRASLWYEENSFQRATFRRDFSFGLLGVFSLMWIVNSKRSKGKCAIA